MATHDISMMLKAAPVVRFIARVGFVKVEMHHLMRHGRDSRRQGVVLVRGQAYDMLLANAVAVGLILALHLDEVKFYVVPVWKLPCSKGLGAPEKIVYGSQVIRGQVEHGA